MESETDRRGALDRIPAHPWIGRLRLSGRWARHFLVSVRRGWSDYARNAVRAELALVGLSVSDAIAPRASVECNICGWVGRRFYPNTGPGYDERDTVCPGCRAQNRHRSLVVALHATTRFFQPHTRVIEVAPMRGFQALCLNQELVDYTSFDLSRFAMTKGDLTRMRFASGSADYFVAMHVLEHIPDDAAALAEIRRVLKPGGEAVMQVPIDWSSDTREYDAPDPRDVGHVRMYGRDFADRVKAHGFEVRWISAPDLVEPETARRYGLCPEPILFARAL